MGNKTRMLALMLGLIAPPAGAEAPLSAIEWLNQNPSQPAALTPPTRQAPPEPQRRKPATPRARAIEEPPTAQSATAPKVQVQRLGEPTPGIIGLVPSSVTGLPKEIWSQSDADALVTLITERPAESLPALQSLLYSLLLAEALPHADPNAAQKLLLARIDKLLDLGALDPAQALVEQAGPERNSALFARWFDITLLTGEEERACSALRRAPHLSRDYSARIFCAARAGAFHDSALMLDTAKTLELTTAHEDALLAWFLEPDVFDDEPPLEVTSAVTPLTYRLHEAIGQALPTATLPLRFAHTELGDQAGWKAQLEAAERLSRTGALPANRLLGVYTARLPAASGGIWDRVEAVQRFEVALGTRNPTAVAKTIGPAWRAVQEAGLAVSFSELFAPDLTGLPLRGRAAQTGFEMKLLSSGYESAAREAVPEGERAAFLAAVAQGTPGAIPAPSPLAEAIADGFAAAPPTDLKTRAENGELGAALLEAIALFETGADGDLTALPDAIAFLRAAGLEDVARRASLQLLLRPRRR